VRPLVRALHLTWHVFCALVAVQALIWAECEALTHPNLPLPLQELGAWLLLPPRPLPPHYTHPLPPPAPGPKAFSWSRSLLGSKTVTSIPTCVQSLHSASLACLSCTLRTGHLVAGSHLPFPSWSARIPPDHSHRLHPATWESTGGEQRPLLGPGALSMCFPRHVLSDQLRTIAGAAGDQRSGSLIFPVCPSFSHLALLWPVWAGLSILLFHKPLDHLFLPWFPR
jgi:hypothetical protein